MREKSIYSSDIRVFAGGKFEKYLVKMPGVLEEFQIAYKEKKVIFLVGGLGGLTGKLCDSIKNRCLAEEFTEEWQTSHNAFYKELQDIARSHNNNANYDNIKSIIENISISELVKKAGLTAKEYERLMQTPFVDECVHLILKGIKNLSSKEGSLNDQA